MAICKECGAQVPETSFFCANCGAAQSAADQGAYEPETSQAPVCAAPAYDPAPAMEQRPIKSSRYAVVGSWRFFWSMVLLSLPLIGWIFTIVWACGGVYNYNLQRLARAFIIWWIANILITVAMWLFGGISLSAIVELISGLIA